MFVREAVARVEPDRKVRQHQVEAEHALQANAIGGLRAFDVRQAQHSDAREWIEPAGLERVVFGEAF